MHLVDGHGLFGSMPAVPLRHVVGVPPLIVFQTVYDGGVCRPSFRIESIRVGFEAFLAIRTFDHETVDIPLSDIRKEGLPDSFAAELHPAVGLVPAGLARDHGDLSGIRRPYGKFGPLHPVLRGDMRSELFIGSEVYLVVEYESGFLLFILHGRNSFPLCLFLSSQKATALAAATFRESTS